MTQTLEELLTEISKKDGSKTVDNLKTELNSLLEDLKKKAPNEDINNLKTISINQLKSRYRKKLFSSNKGTEFQGSFIKVGRKIDMIKNRRKAIIEAYEADPEGAKKKGIVDGAGNPLNFESKETFAKMQDWMIKMRYVLYEDFIKLEEKEGRKLLITKEKFTSENKIGDYETFIEEEKRAGRAIFVNVAHLNKNGDGKYVIGKHMPKTDYSRTCLGIVIIDGNPVKMKINLRKKNADVIPETFKKTTFMGYKKQTSTDTEILLNDSGTFSPKYDGDLDDGTCVYVLEDLYKDAFITLDQIEDFINENQNVFDATLITKINVIEIPAIETQSGSQIVTVSDDTVDLDKIFTCWVSSEIPITFTDTAQIYVIGSGNKNQENGNISINVTGIYVPPIFRNELPISESVAKESEISGDLGGF